MSSYYKDSQKKNRKRFFLLRAWFYVPVLLLVICAAVGALVAWNYLKVYKESAEQFDLEALTEMESASIIYDKEGKAMGRIFVRNRDTIALSDLPHSLVKAVLAAEDNRFYKHNGVDYIGITRAAVTNYRASGIKQGGSTLTMQLARNTFSLTERSYERKLVEVFLAMRVEERYSKNEILEMYLNRVYYGSGFYGAEAAARGYFGKSAKQLDLGEGAILAGLLKSPNNLSPWADRRASIRERNTVLRRMLELEFINEEQHAAAIAKDPDVKNRRPLAAESYVLDFVRQQVIADLGHDRAVSEGFRIYTTIDSALQSSAEKSLQKHLLEVEKREGYEHPTYADYDRQHEAHLRKLYALPPDSEETIPALPAPAYLQGAVLQIENTTGAILAMVGGRSFDHSEYNRAMSASRPPGTAIKPLIYAAAYEEGLHPGYLLEDTALDNRQVMIGGTTGILGEWGAERDNIRFEGRITAGHALTQSKNSATVRLGMSLGNETVFGMIAKAGITSQMRPFPATYLGNSEVTLNQMTNAFTAFPNGGTRPQNTFVIDRIADKDGEVIFRSGRTRVPVMRDSVAWQVHESLSTALQTGSADKALNLHGLRRFDGGGKTGTAYNFTDLWFVGYNRAITTGVWVGFDRPQTIYHGAFSSDVALPVWVDLMNASLDKYPPGELRAPVSIKQIELCRASGLPAMQPCHEAAQSGAANTGVYLGSMDSIQRAAGICPVHNEGMRLASRTLPGQAAPRAVAAFDLADIVPVQIQAPTLLAETDPYSSVTPQALIASRRAVAPGEEEEIEVRRAEAVRPFDQPLDTPVLQIAPPAPMEF